MSHKRTHLLPIGLVVLLSLHLCSERRLAAQPRSPHTDPWSLRARAEKARAARLTHVELGPFGGQHPDILSVDSAARHYNLFVVKPLTAETVVENGREILTWYKALIINRLFTAPPSPLLPALSDWGAAPSDLPSGPDEILILHHGGTITIDSVTFTQTSEDFPQFSLSREYLCLLSINADGKVATVDLEGAGVFEVGAQGTLKSMSGKLHPFTEDMRQSYGNSLTKLATHLRVRTRQ